MGITNIYDSPMYIFNIDILKNRIEYLKSKLTNGGLCYAIKANTFVASAINDYVERFEVCSPGELDICYKDSIDLKKVVVSGVYKDYKVIEDAIKNFPEIGIYTIESLNQLEMLNSISLKYNKNINVLIRLSSGNQFGVDEADFYEIIKNRNLYKNLNFKGLEYYSGTQKTSLRKIEKELLRIDEFITRLSEELEYEVEELEYGPGYPVSYFECDKEFNENEYASGLNELLGSLKYKGRIVLELGRAIAASCGTYYTKIVDVKNTKEQNYAICDGGMNHLVYFGQMMAMKKPYFNVIPNRLNDIKTWSLFGALCSVNDIIMKQVDLDLKVNDILEFKNTGAYCMTEGISLFLSRDLPKVYLYENNKLILVRDSYQTSKLNARNKEV